MQNGKVLPISLRFLFLNWQCVEQFLSRVKGQLCNLGFREITRLDIMAYIDPASNPGSKPQRLGATNCKSSDELQTFGTIFGISCKYQTKNYLHEITLFVLFWRGISCNRNHETFQENKEKNQWFEIKCPVLMAEWLNPT